MTLQIQDRPTQDGSWSKGVEATKEQEGHGKRPFLSWRTPKSQLAVSVGNLTAAK